MSGKTLPSSFLKNVMQNGVGRHVCQLQRVTLSLCKSSTGSATARRFVEEDLLDFTRGNPGVVFYIKPRRHKKPLLTAEYLNGYKEQIEVSRCSKDEIAQWVGLMKGRSGTQIMKLRKEWHTDTPSIQGTWHPFMFKETARNVTDMKDKGLSDCVPLYKSATERILEMYKDQQHQQVGTAGEQSTLHGAVDGDSVQINRNVTDTDHSSDSDCVQSNSQQATA
ncbi:RM43-like protein [Mya arenaria]|uniref:Large ribosomal subunit protein mL43 n=1 Tax=Mya arenaria TaxID=6604 RepID=A0ABY7FKP4_MYAAR|nr:39S ribosomal protein L43, mitochondrial-like [Mya arenaria]WAR21511.1 RM43-like protein [Mya arenaria]